MPYSLSNQIKPWPIPEQSINSINSLLKDVLIKSSSAPIKGSDEQGYQRNIDNLQLMEPFR